METQILNADDLTRIKTLLKQGKVIAFPTDTVYGLGVIYNNEVALNKLKDAKKRDANKPIPLMVRDFEQLKQAVVVNEAIEKLYRQFMPGALTLVCKRNPQIPAYVSNGLDTIAIRIPNNQFILKLLDEPMLVTSANMSGEASLKAGVDVLKQLGGRIDGIVMGEANSTLASTIVDVSTPQIKILRVGIISEEAIMNCLEEEK